MIVFEGIFYILERAWFYLGNALEFFFGWLF